MGVMRVPTEPDRLDDVQEFVMSSLDRDDYSMADLLLVQLAVEEMFLNIASYAYYPGDGEIEITSSFDSDEKELEISFKDSGKQFNPLDIPPPDLEADPMDRDVGGLGIFITRQSMDEVWYEYTDGCNIFTMRKILGV